MLFAMPDPESDPESDLDVDADAVDFGGVVEVADGPDWPAGSLAAWLAEVPPGPQTLAWLASLAPESLDPAERLLALKAWERAHAWVSARLAAATVAAAGPEPTTRDDWSNEEVAAVLRLPTRSAQNKVHTARALAEDLPATLALLAAGEITWRHALVAVEECAPLDRAQAAAVQAAVLPKAPAQSPQAFRRSVRRAVLAAAPGQAQEAMEHALADDVDVRLTALPNGMAEIAATMPALEATALFLAVNTLAKARHAAHGGKRSGVRLGRRRVDALAALANAALADRALPKTHGRRVELQVTVDLPTLLHLAERPAELSGYGPLPAQVARELAGDAAWRRLVTEPVTGHLLDYGAATYRPPQPLVDYVTARDRRCVFPGCENPACGCDLDHAIAHPIGRTSATNCGLLCRRHHRMKTFRPWKLKRHPDGSATWTSPSGLTHHVPPRDQRDP